VALRQTMTHHYIRRRLLTFLTKDINLKYLILKSEYEIILEKQS